MEALGLVTRLLYPQIVRIIDWRLSAIDPDLVGYFWHGVGRGLYFLPINALPCTSSTWRAVEMAQEEPPHSLGRLNALGGLAWAVTLVNLRHPAILETFLKQYGGVISANDAFSTGVSASLMIWYDIEKDDPYLRAFLQYQPDPSNPRLVQLWNSQVRAPAQEALQRYYDVLKDTVWSRRGLPASIFAVLVDRLEGGTGEMSNAQISSAQADLTGIVNLTDHDRALLNSVDSYLSAGLQLKQWWKQTSATNAFPTRFELGLTY